MDWIGSDRRDGFLLLAGCWGKVVRCFGSGTFICAKGSAPTGFQSLPSRWVAPFTKNLSFGALNSRLCDAQRVEARWTVRALPLGSNRERPTSWTFGRCSCSVSARAPGVGVAAGRSAAEGKNAALRLGESLLAV